ncbi:hypothetical protein BCR36DRAFT_323122 [Piromyces finnis]|uniref:Uncharacterized protein n=1 Tax=Piromyces finnis TaxID=1754191 RepID=A0A1Y1VE05_9FUNG|nr:hypothetical protein BCR36DRAFT_323122 [Piromyces finnis]|eukprot:ORX53807.1 hypothetical protein BCR36DRAFT_323122 [Piromyces finnis]
MDIEIKDNLNKILNNLQNKFDEDYLNEFCQILSSYISENPNVNKKLYACQYLKDNFITNATDKTNEIYDNLSWGLSHVLITCVQFIDETIDTPTKNEINEIAIELLNYFLKTSSPKEMLMVYTEDISNLSEINSFNDCNEIGNAPLIFNQLYQFIFLSKALVNSIASIKTKSRYKYLKNALEVLSKGLKPIELLSKRYNQYYFDNINNESTQNDSLYDNKEKDLLNELLEFNIYVLDNFVSLIQKEISTIPDNEQFNILNGLTNPKTDLEMEYYLVCSYFFELCNYGLSYTFTGTSSDFNKVIQNKFKNIIGNYELNDYILGKWYSSIMMATSNLYIDLSKLFYIHNYEKYKEYNEIEDEEDEEEKLNNEYLLSLGGRSALLTSFYYLLNDNKMPKQQLITMIHNFFPNVLSHNFIFYNTLDYLNEMMNSKQDYGVVSHIVSTFDYLMKISGNQLVTLKELKNTSDNNCISLLSILKSYVSLMVMVPYAIMRDRMFIQLKEFVGRLTEEARFFFIMEVIQNSFTESIVVLGIVLYKDALHEAWMKQVFGSSADNKQQQQQKKSLFFSTEFLDIVRKTLFNIKSPIYESFNTDLKFINEEDKKAKSNKESYLDTYDGFWKKFEILFQSLNLYSYLLLRDNKEKLLQIWNNSFNDQVEHDFFYPLKEKVEHWKQYVQQQQQQQQNNNNEEENHHHHHHHHSENPYNYIPDCPEYQLMMMENMIEQLFALRKDFDNNCI